MWYPRTHTFLLLLQYFPFYLFGLGVVINSFLEILFGRFSFGMKSYSLFRKSNLKSSKLSKTLIIPAKNEEGKLSPLDVKIGDIVLFGKWSGTEVKIDGKEYSIMKEADIMGISKSKK